MQKIPLTQGKFAFVDDEDYERLVYWKWFAYQAPTGQWYARRNATSKDGKRCIVHMHRCVLGAHEFDPDVDHRDGDGLNNQKVNLRYTTRSGNAANISVRSDSKSGLKGVYWSKKANRWAAQITTNGKQIWLGYHDTADEAAVAFDRAAILHHGEFARTNFPLSRYDI